MNTKKVELLAPAGNMDALKAAAAGGADAIYLGLRSFSARAFAGNFSHEEFQEAIRYCHIRNIRIYVTINTMLFETEIENAKKEVDFLYNNDCDGILVQDLGLFHYIRTCYPDFDVHCSTQMHIHNLAGVDYMRDHGAKRVVLARETPIEIIREACKRNIEIEVFVYGAICISYSGQCLMSAATKNRSANRGMCAQCCRLKYVNEDGSHFKEGDYILSPKDLNLIDEIPALLDAGVSSLKIEGRMKRPEYVWLVTSVFRAAVDAYYAGKKFVLSEEKKRDLLLMFNRGFSHGHPFHDDVTARMSQHRPNHQGVRIGTVLQYRNGRVQVKLEAPLYQHDGLRILNQPSDTGLTAVRIYDNRDNLVSSARAGDVVWLDCHSKPVPKKGQPLQKTSDTRLISAIDEEIEKGRKVLLTMEYHAAAGAPLAVTVTDAEGRQVTALSSMEVQVAKNAPLSKEKIEASLNKCGDTAYVISDIHGESGNIFLPVKEINETRRKALELMDDARAKRHERAGFVPYHFELKEQVRPETRLLIESDASIPGYAVFTKGYGPEHVRPIVDENYSQVIQGEKEILSSYCDLAGQHDQCVIGMSFNIANSYAMAYVLSHPGIIGVIVSSEMNNAQIRQSMDAFKERYGFEPCLYRLVYGKRDAMLIKDSFMKRYDKRIMKDIHGNVYPIDYNGSVTRILEPDLYRSDNPYCYGSYVILHGEEGVERILEEANEELFERI